jgi:thymidylate synthase
VELERDSLDGILIDLYKNLIEKGGRNEGGTRGANTELLGVTLRLTDPRARISRSEDRGRPFSAVGELLWYLIGSDQLEFIKPYIPRYEEDAVDGVLPGAYGPRLFGMHGKHDQVANVIRLLSNSPGSRRAVIQLFDASDIATRPPEIPCTTTIQFHARGNLLHMSVTMRSNDAYWGLPHDVFCFTMIQEMMARRLGLELGQYIHHAGSLHVYDEFVGGLRGYIDEGYQRPMSMARMPDGDPFALVAAICDAEDRIRHGESVSADDVAGPGYWADFVRLFKVFWATGRGEQLDELKGAFVDPIFRTYLEGRRHMKIRPYKVRTAHGDAF